MLAADHQWTFRHVDPDTWMLFYGNRQAATVRWCVRLRHPNLAMQRIIDGLAGDLGPCPGRTWGWQRVGRSTRIELLHNGVAAGEIEWLEVVQNKTRWSIRAIDGMNHDRGDALPFPEPLPARPTEFVDGGFDVNDRSAVA